jgi:hypothetical protein
MPELRSVPPLTYAPINELNDRHRAIAQLEVMGWKNSDIAKELGVHEMTIYRVRNSPVYKIYIKDLRKRVEDNAVFDVAAYLTTMTEETFRTMADLMRNAESENVRGAMVKEFADRISPKVARSEHKEETVIHFGDSVQNLAKALADTMRIDPARLHDKSDTEVLDLLEAEFDAPFQQEEPSTRLERNP